MKKWEFVTKMPLLELVGDQRVLVENHLGIISYSLDKLQIKVSYGALEITGKRLQFLELCREQMVITGQIENISLLRR